MNPALEGLIVHEVTLDGLRLTLGKVRQLDSVLPTVEGFMPRARYRDTSDKSPVLHVIGELDGQAVRTKVVPRQNIGNWSFRSTIVDADIYNAWMNLPLVLLL